VSNVIINPFRPTNLGTGQEVEAGCSTRRLARFVDKKAGSLRDECEQAPALANLRLRVPGLWVPASSNSVGEVGEIRLCPVKPGDGGQGCAAVFQRSRRWFLTIDTRADSFVTSVRINNVILRRVPPGRWEDLRKRALRMHFSLASSQVYRLALRCKLLRALLFKMGQVEGGWIAEELRCL
jgi:hypothetical protein